MIYEMPHVYIENAIRCGKCGDWIPAKSEQYTDWLSSISLFDDGVGEAFFHIKCVPNDLPRVQIRYGGNDKETKQE
jgi:hypothetical protein